MNHTLSSLENWVKIYKNKHIFCDKNWENKSKKEGENGNLRIHISKILKSKHFNQVMFLNIQNEIKIQFHSKINIS